MFDESKLIDPSLMNNVTFHHLPEQSYLLPDLFDSVLLSKKLVLLY